MDKRPKAVFTMTINIFSKEGVSEPIAPPIPSGFIMGQKMIPIGIEKAISETAHELSKKLGQIWKYQEINYLTPPEIEVDVEYEGGHEASLTIKVENDIPV